MNDFQERINRLSGQQMLLLARQLGIDGTTNSGQTNTIHSIAAYLVADEPIEPAELREGLKDKLPEYMIPSKFVQLDELPRLPNGKIDMAALKPPVEDMASVPKKSFSAPKNEVEHQLVQIWEEVLGFRPIGVQDNFFEIGGDSILSIQIIAKARQKGILLAPNQLFENQTISELALFAKTENKNVSEEKVVGAVPLLPIQHWFFEEHNKAPHYWNQAMLFDVPERLDKNVLQKSIDYLMEHHDALRLGFQRTEEGWAAFVAEPAAINAFHSIDLTALSPLQTDAAIEEKARELQATIDLSKAGLFQTLVFENGQDKYKMLLVVHHLIIDAVSWQILLSDLESICLQLSRNQATALSSKTTSYYKWGKHLNALSTAGKFDDEAIFWKAQKSSEKIPVDFDAQLPIAEKSTRTLTVDIDAATTEALLKSSNEAYHTKTEELLITALMLAFEKWGGIRNLCLGFEKHGRSYNQLDVSNTVGWFTTYFPVALNMEDATNLKDNIIAVKETLRSIPNEGLGYGVLRYLKKLDGLTQSPEVIFNFLGIQKPFDSEILGKGKFVLKGVRSAESERYHLLEINAFIMEGHLHLQFSFSEIFHKAKSIRNLVELFEIELRNLIGHCSNRETSAYSPSDFPEADLNQDDLDNLLNQIN